MAAAENFRIVVVEEVIMAREDSPFRITGEFKKSVGGTPVIEVKPGEKEGFVVHIPRQTFKGKEIPEATFRGRDQTKLVNQAASHVISSEDSEE